ncbi:hypothetical protein MHUMG1_01802 [Metarhizium humberi]|uniref:Uncharacterized protein n=1 Tax=Metarhizium humberi TaxID=2596975 RepID=A0A9P8MI17_9HYPO|nr:hypothetical protein MHUMG1_01802 [Metarhizium humberi]
MQQQDPHDDLSPLADLTSAAQERLSYVRAQGSRRLSRQAVLNRSLSFGRPNFEPVVPSPLGQPSWNQESVPSPESPVEQNSDDDGPRLDQGYDKEPVVLHLAGLERVSPEVWAPWYVEQRDDGSAQAAGVTERLYKYLFSILLSTGAYRAAFTVTCCLVIIPAGFTAVGRLQYRSAATPFTVYRHV